MLLRSISLFLLILAVSGIALPALSGQIHPKEALGRKIFDSFRQNKFSDFYLRSIFSLEEEQFRDLLFNLENFELRQKLLQFYTLDYPAVPRLRSNVGKLPSHIPGGINGGTLQKTLPK
jgi:hypothetical protein